MVRLFYEHGANRGACNQECDQRRTGASCMPLTSLALLLNGTLQPLVVVRLVDHQVQNACKMEAHVAAVRLEHHGLERTYLLTRRPYRRK